MDQFQAGCLFAQILGDIADRLGLSPQTTLDVLMACALCEMIDSGRNENLFHDPGERLVAKLTIHVTASEASDLRDAIGAVYQFNPPRVSQRETGGRRDETKRGRDDLDGRRKRKR